MSFFIAIHCIDIIHITIMICLVTCTYTLNLGTTVAAGLGAAARARHHPPARLGGGACKPNWGTRMHHACHEYIINGDGMGGEAMSGRAAANHRG